MTDIYLGTDYDLRTEITVDYGTDFAPFTPREWYDVNKANFDELPPESPATYSTISRSTITYSDYNPSSGTDTILKKTTTKPTNTTAASTALLQTQLNEVLGTKLAVDGWYGNKTEAAVKELQQKAGLPTTGVVDEATLANLMFANDINKIQKSVNEQIKVYENSGAYTNASVADKGTGNPNTFGTVSPTSQVALVGTAIEVWNYVGPTILEKAASIYYQIAPALNEAGNYILQNGMQIYEGIKNMFTKAEDATKEANEGAESKRRTDDQQALHDLAREAAKKAKNGQPITEEEAKALDSWAKEYGVPQHHQSYPGSGQHFPGGNYQDHTHIYNEHVPYK